MIPSLASTSARLSCMALMLAALAGCERPPIDTNQWGYRGTGMVQVSNPRAVAALDEANAVPSAPRSRSMPDAPKARELYKSAIVLGDLNVVEFGRMMTSMTQWVAPDEGCAYCHVGGDFADDSKYTKVVARRMLQMVREVNLNWTQHVGATGVTCYTCHRGKPVPLAIWFEPDEPQRIFAGNRDGQNRPAPAVGLTSLPVDPFSPYLLKSNAIGVNAAQALPTGTGVPLKQAETTYALMMSMSQSLGVNCTFCHNSRAFASWESSPPQRLTAWHGIRMVRTLNVEIFTPLSTVLPPERLGPHGDAPKLLCATCHQGVNKPLRGAAMAADYPALTTANLAQVGAAPR